MTLESRNQGSYRDPFGSVFEINGRVFRGIKQEKKSLTQQFLSSSFYKENAGDRIVRTHVRSSEDVLAAGLSHDAVKSFSLWVEHERLNLITYPYEWSFEFLRKAAIFHLDLHIDALSAGYQLKDASAYNVQFIGCNPVFIDTLSFEKYSEGDRWVGYKQFCEQFLGPLALGSYKKVDINSWLRGSLDGLSIIDVSKLLPVRSFFSITLLGNIHMQAWAMAKIASTTSSAMLKKQSAIPKKNLIALLSSLRRFIEKLKTPTGSYWNNYDVQNSYYDESIKEKEKIVDGFVSTGNLQTVLDIGCNSGHFSEVAFKAGANKVIGLDIDDGAVSLAANKTSLAEKEFTPLKYDFTNPSPSMGWGLRERLSLEHRLPRIDGIICLALIHHLVIGKNIPISEFVEWITQLSPRGLIEFVPKEDPMVEGLLANREDVFFEYNEQFFIDCLAERAKVEKIISLTHSKRKFILYAAHN